MGNTDIAHWFGLGLFGASMFVAFWLRMKAKHPTALLKLLLLELVYFGSAFAYGMMAMGAGRLVVAGHDINWLRYVLYAATHGAFVAFAFASLDPNWGKYLIGFFLGTGSSLFLVFGALSSVQNGNWYAFAFSALCALALAVYTLFWVHLPEDKLGKINNNTHWVVKGLLILAVFTYVFVGYIIDTTGTDAVKHDITLMESLYVGFDAIVKVFIGLWILAYVDLFEESGGSLSQVHLMHGIASGAGAPHLLPVHGTAQAANDMNGSNYSVSGQPMFGNGYSYPQSSGIGLKLPS